MRGFGRLATKKIADLCLFARYIIRDYHKYGMKRLCASGLVVKFNVAIVEPRVRFSAGACPTLLPPRAIHLAPGVLVLVLEGVGGVGLGRLAGCPASVEVGGVVDRDD